MADLTYIDEYSDWFDCTLASGYTRNTVQGQFNYRIEPNADKSGYDLSVWTRLRTKYNFNWSGDGNLSVVVTWRGSDGSTKKYSGSIETQTPLYIEENTDEYQETDWNGPVKFAGIPAVGVETLNFDVDLDFLRTTCLICYEDGVTPAGHGPGVASTIWEHDDPGYDHDHYQHFYDTRSISVKQIPLLQPSVISDIVNTNKYNDSDGISASTDMISLSWTVSGTAGTSYYKLGDGSWNELSNATSVNIPNLTAGTTYDIKVKNTNSAGDSNILSITVRTRHSAPVITLTYKSSELEALKFEWSSDKELDSAEYKINDGEWIDRDFKGIKGNFTVSQLEPNTKYTIYVRGTSISTYDSLESNEASASGTTNDIARIETIGNCIFGKDITITIKNVATDVTKLKIWTNTASKTIEFVFDVTDKTYTFKPTQNQLDQMYRCYTNKNEIPIYFQVYVTGSKSKQWFDDEYQKSLQLTGIVKTAYIGVEDKPMRAQAFIGVDGKPMRAIAWIGDVNGKARRCT